MTRWFRREISLIINVPRKLLQGREKRTGEGETEGGEKSCEQ